MLKALALLAAISLALSPVCTFADDFYTNVDGHRVHRPVHSNHVPSGATAKCRDGTYSFSQHHRGTCSHHGGVEAWL